MNVGEIDSQNECKVRTKNESRYNSNDDDDDKAQKECGERGRMKDRRIWG